MSSSSVISFITEMSYFSRYFILSFSFTSKDFLQMHLEQRFDCIKKIICLEDFLWFKIMFHLNEIKFIWFKQVFICPKDILFELNKSYLIQINILFKSKKAFQTIYFLSFTQIFFLHVSSFKILSLLEIKVLMRGDAHCMSFYRFVQRLK